MQPVCRGGALLALVLGGFLTAAAAPPASEEPVEPLPEKVVRLDAENWRWVPNVIRVVRGTKLVLKIQAYDATHRLDLPEFGLKVLLPQDEETTVEFVADKVGTFRWKCGRPCGDGCPKMTGTLTVLEPPPPAPPE